MPPAGTLGVSTTSKDNSTAEEKWRLFYAEWPAVQKNAGKSR
jgi:hypothetical protein